MWLFFFETILFAVKHYMNGSERTLRSCLDQKLAGNLAWVSLFVNPSFNESSNLEHSFLAAFPPPLFDKWIELQRPGYNLTLDITNLSHTLVQSTTL